jgi:hypothetical protein
MITPMTNIEQSVGRILRQKHDFSPIVVDIIDTHDNFQRQWNKRKSFYKKQNYKIMQNNSFNYTSDITKWKLIYEPTLKQAVDNVSEEEEPNDKNTKGVCLLKCKKMI